MLKVQSSTNHIKCGEVFYIVPSIFHINCIECGQKILFQQFLQHYRLQHLTQSEDSIDIEPIRIRNLPEYNNELEEADEEQDLLPADSEEDTNDGNDSQHEENTDSMATWDESEFLDANGHEEYIEIEQIAYEPDDDDNDDSIQNEDLLEDDGNETAPQEQNEEQVMINDNIAIIQNENKPFKCQICHRLLKTKYILINHMRVVHSEKLSTPDSSITCRFCNMNCKSRFDLLVHKRKYHADRYASSHFGAVKTQAVEDEMQRPVPCTLCERRFRNESSLAIHMRIHKDKQKTDAEKTKVVKTFICELCGKVCRSRRHLERHQKHYHGSSICDICKKEFKQPIDAYRHRSLHFKPKKFKCVHCDIACYSPSGLQKHLRTHTTKERREHSIARQKPSDTTRRNICEICGRDFRTSYQLNNHMQRHNNERPFKCDNCDKSFYSRPLLRLHCVTHSSDRPFVCDICGATFQYKRALRVHTDLHTGFRNYKCEHCEKAYVDGGRLKTHIRLVHGYTSAATTKPQNDTNEDSQQESNAGNIETEVEIATKNLAEFAKHNVEE